MRFLVTDMKENETNGKHKYFRGDHSHDCPGDSQAHEEHRGRNVGLTNVLLRARGLPAEPT